MLFILRKITFNDSLDVKNISLICELIARGRFNIIAGQGFVNEFFGSNKRKLFFVIIKENLC